MPRSRAQLQHAIKYFEESGLAPEEVFAYPCPQCHTQARTPPIAVCQFRAILSELRDTLKDELSEIIQVGDLKEGSTHFKGLFLPSKTTQSKTTYGCLLLLNTNSTIWLLLILLFIIFGYIYTNNTMFLLLLLIISCVLYSG